MRMFLLGLAAVCVTGALAADEKIKVTCIGDSITWGYALTNRVKFAEELTGPDLWAQRASHPAVVNPVLGQDAANVISLRGEWEFMTRDEFGRNRPGPVCDWMWDPKPWDRKISVPGCWEAQGVGEPGMSVCWNITTDQNAKPIRHRHMGVGCYRRTVDVPASWRGKRIWLKVGGAKSVAWFHVNGTHVACVDNYCGTYKYEITDLVVPGETATVVAQVRNDVPSRKGLLSAMHRWGGLYRDVELEATPTVFIDDAWVRGDFDKQLAEVHVEIAGKSDAGNKVRVTVEGETKEVALRSTSTPSTYALEIPLRNFRPWTPEHPNLYTGLVELVENGRVIHVRRERFGVRKLEVRGKAFYLNGRPYFFRGFGDDHVYPITGITPADVDVHRRHLALARKAGFNVVRLHTHTEVPEYFEAADELGILIEAELPYYNNEPPEGQAFDPKRDVTELWRNYRRHPSFGVYSMGNEGSFGGKLDRALHRYVKAMDPDRLKINQDSSFAGINPPESADYTGGPIMEWKRGSFNPDRPFVNHEYLNLGAKLDSRLESRFTGVWQPPVTRDGRKAWLETFGLDLEWGDRLQDASHALQAVYQKRGIESLRCDPYSDGYHFWTIVDVVVSNLCTYSAQGLFTPFWEPKSRGLSAEDFAVFNSPSCVLLDKALGSMVFTAGEAFSSDVLLAHYGDEALADNRLDWTLAAEGRSLGAGSVPVGNQPVGAVRKVAELSFKMPSVARPVKATLALSLISRSAQAVSNSWSCWIFPVREKRAGRRIAVAEPYRAKLERRYGTLLPAARALEAEVVIAPFGSRLAVESLKRGQRVIALDGMDGEPNVSMGWWFMGAQVGTGLLRHPAFGDLPHEGVLSPLLFRILKTGRKLPFPGLVGEGGDACYLYLAQAKSGKGRLLLSFGLDVLSDTPEGAALLDGFVDYALSDGFNPESEVALAPSEGNEVKRKGVGL